MFMNFFGLVNTLFILIRAFVVQRNFVKAKLLPIIDSAYDTTDGTLPDKNKLVFNYSTLVPMLLGTAYCVLRGSRITPAERYASTVQAAFSVLFDSFFDDNIVLDMNLETLFDKLYEVKGVNSIETLFIILFKCYWETGYVNNFKEYYYKILEAENFSKIQEDCNATLLEINSATEKKGGYAMLFYRSAFKHNITDAEETLLYKLGKAVQISNDAFDIYKDYSAGIRTLVTECHDFNNIKNDYLQLISEIRICAFKLDIPSIQIRRFLQIMSLSVFSRTLVCFDAMLKNQQLSDGEFVIADYSRNQLVVDMEKPSNILKMFGYFLSMNYTKKGAASKVA